MVLRMVEEKKVDDQWLNLKGFSSEVCTDLSNLSLDSSSHVHIVLNSLFGPVIQVHGPPCERRAGNDQGNLGFLSKKGCLNVLLTRQEQYLFVIGDITCCGSDFATATE